MELLAFIDLLSTSVDAFAAYISEVVEDTT